jgi:DNA repair exonuclease SbcCD ATPase subunit
MAETRKIKIDVESNADEAAKDFKKVADNIDDSTDSVKRLNKEVKKTDDAADGASKGFKKISSAAKGLGLALKGAGIGLIIGALAGLKSAFESSGETASGFQKIMETLSILFNQTIGALVNAAKAAYESTGGFNALGKVMGGLLNIALTPLKLAFYGIKLGVQELQLAWEKSFLGDKDPKTIKELRKNIKATQKDIDQVGKDFIKSGKDITDNFIEAATEVIDFGGKAIQNLSKISVTAAYEQASALVDARNNAAVAAAQQGRLVEIYDRQAETLRQIRDEERNSIPERIAANNKLKEVLDEQEKAMLRQADLQIQAAQLEYNKSKTVENQVALTEALANREGVLAQVQGLRSEQLANDLALQREADELVKARTESEITLAIEREKAGAEFISTEEQKLEKLIEIANKERELQLNRLQEQIDIHKEGTQARLDAEIAYNEQKQALDIQLEQYENQLSAKRIETQKKTNEEIKADDEKLRAAQINMAQTGLSIIADLAQEFGQKNEESARRAFKVQKAANLASAIISTYTAVNAALTAGGNPAKLATGAQFIEAGVALATGLASVAKIAKTKFETTAPDSTDVGGGGGGGSVMSPNFNVVGNSGMNQLAQIQQQPIQAYVVSGEVTSAQALDRNRIKNATL